MADFPSIIPSGFLDSRIYCFSDMPGKEEILSGTTPETRLPFSGGPGYVMNNWLREVGIDREALRLDYVVQERRPGGIAGIELDELEELLRAFQARISRLVDPHVLVPLGSYALFFLLGIGKSGNQPGEVPPGIWKHFRSERDNEKDISITKARGGIYLYKDRGKGREREVKVVPSLHPKATMNTGAGRNFTSRCVADWRLIAYESTFRHRNERPEQFNIDPSEQDAKQFTKEIEGGKWPLAVDIETWSGSIDCVGFAPNGHEALVLPTETPRERRTFIPYIKRLCESKAEKVLQNGLFDAYWLKRTLDIDLVNYIWDSLSLHHAIDPVEEHSLNFLASIYTYPRLNYWKDEAKGEESISKYAKTREKKSRYNAKDVTSTWEIADRLKAELITEGRLDFYMQHYAALFPPVLDMMLTGMFVDTRAQGQLAEMLQRSCAEIRERLNSYYGDDLYATKDFSQKDLRLFLIDILGMQPFVRWGKESLDRNALLKMGAREPHKAGRIIGDILEHRGKAKEIQYLDGKWDMDGRIRYSFKFNTEAGRFASSKNPMRGGFNIMNVKRG